MCDIVSNVRRMVADGSYRLSIALMGDGVTEQFVIVDADDRLHVASSWLLFLASMGRSPNTVKSYGSRIAEYLSWTAQTADWRGVTLSHLAMWRNTVAATPVTKKNAAPAMRKTGTVSAWIAPLRSFYEWADAEGMLNTDVARRMSEMKYFAPGTGGGGEHGKMRKVLARELKSLEPVAQVQPLWIDKAEARQKLENLEMNPRDRFLVDIMYYTGIRVGEALSLFTADLHFSTDSRSLGCNKGDPHFHVKTDNPVENGARAKGKPRHLHVTDDLIEKYIDYALERNRILGSHDQSPHVFVNLYSQEEFLGRALTYSTANSVAASCAAKINFPLSGPHIFRHTLATRLRRGIDCEAQDLDVIQVILGHSSIDSTRIYTHDMESVQKAALKSVAPRTVSLGPDS